MGETAILEVRAGEKPVVELRTVNVKKDLERQGVAVEGALAAISFGEADYQLRVMNCGILEIIESAGFVHKQLGIYAHPDGSRVVGNRHADFSSPEWFSDVYLGYGCRETVLPVFRRMEEFYTCNASLRAELTPVQP
ncbi:Uncharacterised protein [uncultured archaeon]|nr:Uncharacterised protein [uncultured archaeon]